MTGLLMGTAPSVAGLAARVTLLLLLALALAWLGRRGSPRTLHLLWTTTFALVLALPLLGLFGPSWNVPILPSGGGEAEPASIAAPAGMTPPQTTELQDAQASVHGPRLDTPATEPVRSAPSPITVFVLVWAIGCVLALVSLGASAVRLRELIRSAHPLRDPEWLREADVVRQRTGIRGEVRLLSSEAAATPMTGGFWKPVILLPPSATDWSPARRAVVLAHELIHVRRRDALRQLAGRVVLALYWFHPLSWLASRLATLASEKACDEEVLRLGMRPSDYARHLLLLASGLRPDPNVLALPIVKSSQLESRIMSILERQRPRPSVVRTTITLTVIGIVAVCAAAARPIPIDEAPALPAEPESPPIIAPAAEPRPDPVALRLETSASQAIQCSFSADSMRTMVIRGQGITLTGWRNGDRTIEKSVGGLHLCMRTHGDVVMSDDGTSVRAVGADSWIVLESSDEKVHRLVVTEDPGGIEHQWSVDGVSRTFDAQARQWRDLMFTVLRGYEEAWGIRSRSEEAALRGQIASHRGRVASFRGQSASHRGHVASLRGRIASNRGHVASLLGQIASRRGRVASMNGRIAGYRGRISALRSAMALTTSTEAREAIEEDIREWDTQIRQTEEEIDRYDLDGKVREIEAEIEDYDLPGRVATIQQQIEDYDLAGKVAAIEAEIEAYDLEGKTREIERMIEELDTDARAEEVERSLEDEITELRRLTR